MFQFQLTPVPRNFSVSSKIEANHLKNVSNKLCANEGKMAGVAGLEPVTSAVTGQRSNQLSYTPAKGNETIEKTGRTVKFCLGKFSDV